jgi:hypothetical protein
MIRSLLKLGFLLVAGILVYNYLFGTSEEKAQSKEVFQKTGSALSSAWSLLKSERQKFDAGKYDKALDQLGGAYREVRDRAQYVDEKVLRRLDDLEQRKASLEKELDGIEMEDKTPQTPPPAPKKGLKAAATAPDQSAKATDNQRKKENLMRELDNLMNDTDKLLKEAQQ